jgi:hypothetical protein
MHMRYRPINPLTLIKSLWALENRRLRRHIQQEFTEIRSQLRLLVRWELTMSVVSILRKSHRVRSAKCLPDFVRRLHTPVAAHRAQPLIRRVLDGQEGSRGDHTGEHEVVEWKQGCFVDELVEAE